MIKIALKQGKVAIIPVRAVRRKQTKLQTVIIYSSKDESTWVEVKLYIGARVCHKRSSSEGQGVTSYAIEPSTSRHIKNGIIERYVWLSDKEHLLPLWRWLRLHTSVGSSMGILYIHFGEP